MICSEKFEPVEEKPPESGVEDKPPENVVEDRKKKKKK